MEGTYHIHVGPDETPQRFVSVFVAGARHDTFAIDASSKTRPMALAYLDTVRQHLAKLKAATGKPADERLTTSLVAQLIGCAFQDGGDPELAYLNAFALTEAMGERFVVVEVDADKPGFDLRAIQAATYAEAKARLEAELGIAPSALDAPGMKH